MRDYFGNLIDPEVDYARGKILKSSYEEKLKYFHAVDLIRRRFERHGEDSLHVFTGNIRFNQLKPSDLGILSEEWIGPSLFSNELKEVAIQHLSGNQERDEVAIFNRTSAANICSILALADSTKTVVSLAPENKHHPSIVRGARLAQANLICVSTAEELNQIDLPLKDNVCVITSVTSELLYLNEDEFINSIKAAKSKGMYVVVDDAYGARIRPILFKLTPSLKAGADVVITNNDKAALHGPRAGIMVGRKDLVNKISSKASELGFEARAPLRLAVYRSLSSFEKQDLVNEVETGKKIYQELVKEIGDSNVRLSILGPEISAETVLKLVLSRRDLDPSISELVPSEASAAMGMELLESYGIITTNACGMPGARISIRLKTNSQVLEQFGGVSKLIDAFSASLDRVGSYVNDLQKARKVILNV